MGLWILFACTGMDWTRLDSLLFTNFTTKIVMEFASRQFIGAMEFAGSLWLWAFVNKVILVSLFYLVILVHREEKSACNHWSELDSLDFLLHIFFRRLRSFFVRIRSKEKYRFQFWVSLTMLTWLCYIFAFLTEQCWQPISLCNQLKKRTSRKWPLFNSWKLNSS